MRTLTWTEVPNPGIDDDERLWECNDEHDMLASVYVPLYCDGNGIAAGACHRWRGDEPCQSQGRPFRTWFNARAIRLEDSPALHGFTADVGWGFGPSFATFDEARAWVEGVFA